MCFLSLTIPRSNTHTVTHTNTKDLDIISYLVKLKAASREEPEKLRHLLLFPVQMWPQSHMTLRRPNNGEDAHYLSDSFGREHLARKACKNSNGPIIHCCISSALRDSLIFIDCD